MREAAMFLAGLVAGGALLGLGYLWGREDLLTKVKKYYSIHHAANPWEGRELIRFLEK